MLDFVTSKYKHILQGEEWTFLRKFYALTEDEQCTFIRLSNRKGKFFLLQKLNYEEIEQIQETLVTLKKKGFVITPQVESFLDRQAILSIFRKDQLKEFTHNAVPYTAKKPAFIEAITQDENNWDSFIHSHAFSQVIQAQFQQEVTFLKFLFFGNRYMDMSEFVIRDLGVMQYPNTHSDQLVSQFQTREEALDKWELADQVEIFKQLKKEQTPAVIFNWIATYLESKPSMSSVAKPAYENLLIQVGQYLERNKEYEKALHVYKYAHAHPSKERRVRCLTKLSLHEEAIALCEEMESKSILPDEFFFAKDFKERVLFKKRKNKKLTTIKLHEAQAITISEEWRGSVEAGTIAHFENEGYHAIFSENYTWRCIFGLVFWDLIFDPEMVAFHHPFQRKPSDLHLPEFYKKRSTKIEGLLTSIENKAALIDLMWNRYQKHEGTANPFIYWGEGVWDICRLVVDRIPLDSLLQVLHHMSKDLSELSRGFPDLLIWNENHYEFIEVKSPTDNLSNRQLYWLNFFEKNNINASVLRVFFDENLPLTAD